MKKHKAKSKPENKKSLIATARSALIHVMVFGVISTTGHVAVTSLSASVGSVGSSLLPPIGGMVLM
ncbi:MAG TPA: hypothetical protein PLF22_09965 [Pseudomonadales bacterium]|nr:hypothetical protein [Pseudomonadales bacterium]